jgi:hypothetical protein
MRKPDRHGRRRAALAVAVAGVLGTAGPALAFDPQPDPPGFGMVGLARTQTAVLNAVLTHPSDPAQPGCTVELSFVDARGQVFTDRAGNEVKRTFVLQDSVAVGLRLRAGDVLRARGLRRSIRPVACLATGDAGDAPSACGRLAVTLEIVDGNGHTSILDARGIPPPCDPPPPGPR